MRFELKLVNDCSVKVVKASSLSSHGKSNVHAYIAHHYYPIQDHSVHLCFFKIRNLLCLSPTSGFVVFFSMTHLSVRTTEAHTI